MARKSSDLSLSDSQNEDKNGELTPQKSKNASKSNSHATPQPTKAKNSLSSEDDEASQQGEYDQFLQLDKQPSKSKTIKN